MISLWEGQIKTFTNQAENLFSKQEMHWLPENIFVTMLALLAFASPSQADLINNTYWVYIPQFSSVQFSRSVVSDSLRLYKLQHARPPCPSPNPGVHSDSHPSSQWCHPAISSSVFLFSSCPQSLPPSESFTMSQLITWGGQILDFQPYNHSFRRNPRADLLQNGLVGSPCSSRDSQESSPKPQFKIINSPVLSFLHSPTFTSIHDQCKNHSLD